MVNHPLFHVLGGSEAQRVVALKFRELRSSAKGGIFLGRLPTAATVDGNLVASPLSVFGPRICPLEDIACHALHPETADIRFGLVHGTPSLEPIVLSSDLWVWVVAEIATGVGKFVVVGWGEKWS